MLDAYKICDSSDHVFTYKLLEAAGIHPDLIKLFVNLNQNAARSIKIYFMMRKQMCLFPGTTLTSPVEPNKCSFVLQLKTPPGRNILESSGCKLIYAVAKIGSSIKATSPSFGVFPARPLLNRMFWVSLTVLQRNVAI